VSISIEHLEFPVKNQTFASVPNWIMKRTEISGDAKILYGRLFQYKGKGNFIFPKRETLAEEIGVHVRAVDRFLRELTKHNLIAIKQVGCNRSNQYTILPHIWMKSAQTYQPKKSSVVECPKSSTPECPKMDTPYKDEKIILKYNILHSKSNDLVDRNRPDIHEKFEQWWMIYPRKQGKKKTFSYFLEALKHTDFETLICKARSYARMREKITEVKPDQVFYTKMPHNWLDGWAWEDHYGKFEIEPPVFQKVQPSQEKIDIPENREIRAVREKIRQIFGESSYVSWFKNTKIDIEGRTLVIKTRSRFIAEWIKTNFESDILTILGGQFSFLKTYEHRMAA